MSNFQYNFTLIRIDINHSFDWEFLTVNTIIKMYYDFYVKLQSFAIRYKVEVAGKSLPVLTTLDKGRYGVIVFESLSKYANMDKWNRELLDKYCREYSVGVVAFATPGEETLVGAQLKGFPLFMHTNLRLKVRRHYLNCIILNHLQPINVQAQAFLMDYTYGERAITHHAGTVRVGPNQYINILLYTKEYTSQLRFRLYKTV
jgi:hypothetical protein